jgi:hypothetical protein
MVFKVGGEVFMGFRVVHRLENKGTKVRDFPSSRRVFIPINSQVASQAALGAPLELPNNA